jgi:hypothetical protein
MIIRNDYLNRGNNYLEMEKKGLDKAIQNFDKRFRDNQVERTNFLKGMDNFAKKQKDLNKRIKKLDR